MQITSTRISVETSGPGLYEMTRDARSAVGQARAHEGQLLIFCRHTSASLTIQENADPDVCRDLNDFFAEIAPRTRPYRHNTEGPDDMPAHIKAALTQTSLAIPITDGELGLGTWQGIYLFEHRDRPHRREILLQILFDT